MDFHVWAKLDPEGRIQSVQSSCTQLLQRRSPVLQYSSTEPLDDGQVQSDNAQSEKVVPYVEKKDLVYKLDAKVDEMAVMITQMAELSKRVKVQEKLIGQYEDKLVANKKKIKALENENAELKYHPEWTRRPRSFPICSDLKSFKSSSLKCRVMDCHEKSCWSLSWPRDSRLPNSNYTKKITDKRQNYTENRDCDCVHGECEQFQHGDTSNDSRDQSHTMSLGFDIKSSSSGTDMDFVGHFNNHPREALIRNGYSYVKRQEPLILQSCSMHEENGNPVDDRETKNTKASVTSESHKTCLVGHVGKDGYLDMNHSKDMFYMDDNFYSFGQEMDDNLHREAMQTEGVCTACADNEAIHSSWIDIKNGKIITRQDDGDGLVLDGYLEPMGCHHDYVSIPDDKTVDYTERPPIHDPRSSRTDSQDSSETINKRSLSRTFPSNSTDEMALHMPRDRSTSLPNTPTSPPSIQGPRKDVKRCEAIQSRSTNSFEHLAKPNHHDRSFAFVSSFERRSQGTDIRKDDDLNKVFKDMRTTMEWNKAKKKLISISHHNTVDTVEARLRSTVQDVYEAFNALQSEQGLRKRCTKDRVLEKIKEKIRTSHGNDMQSEEFMKKCLDLVQSTSQHAKTP